MTKNYILLEKKNEIKVNQIETVNAVFSFRNNFGSNSNFVWQFYGLKSEILVI